MNYSMVFTCGYTDDIESLTREFKGDVLLRTPEGTFYETNFITLDRLRGEFDSTKSCYLETNLVLLHEITKESILQSVEALHQWRFTERWRPLTPKQIETYYYPKEDWVVFTVTVGEVDSK